MRVPRGQICERVPTSPPPESSPPALQELIDAAPDAMVAIDRRGQIVWANRHVVRMFGWEQDQLVGESVERLIPARFARGHPALRARYLTAPTTRPMGAGLDLWARRHDGTEFAAPTT